MTRISAADARRLGAALPAPVAAPPRAPGGLPRVAAAGWLLYECDVLGGERHRWRKLDGTATRWGATYEEAMRETLERRQKAESRKQ